VDAAASLHCVCAETLFPLLSICLIFFVVFTNYGNAAPTCRFAPGAVVHGTTMQPLHVTAAKAAVRRVTRTLLGCAAAPAHRR
jgi:hypothetical protein